MKLYVLVPPSSGIWAKSDTVLAVFQFFHRLISSAHERETVNFEVQRVPGGMHLR
jgi:hypothetical protein